MDPLEQVEPLTNYMPIAIVLGLALTLSLAIYLIYSRVSKQESHFGSAEKEFELNMMRQLGVSPSNRTSTAMPAMPPTLPSGAATLSTAPPTAQSHASPSPSSATASASIGEFDNLSEFARKIATRLTAANMIEGVDGPLRSRNPEIIGTILCIRGNKKIAVIESGWKTPDPDLEMVLSLLDGVIIAGPGDEPLFVRRLQSYIGDSIRL